MKNKKTLWAITLVICFIFVLSFTVNAWAATGTKRQKRTIVRKIYTSENKYETNNYYQTQYNDNWIYRNFYNTINLPTQYHWSSVTNNTTEVHRVIAGSARMQTQNGGNWWDNDWNHVFDANGNLLAIHNISAHKTGLDRDTRKAYKDQGIFKNKKDIHSLMSSKLNQSDVDYLKSLTKKEINFKEKTMYYFDLTSQTWKEGPNIGNVTSGKINRGEAGDWHNVAQNSGFQDYSTSREYNREIGRWVTSSSTSSTTRSDLSETGRNTVNNVTYDKKVEKTETIVDTEILDPYTEIVTVVENTVNTFITNNNFVTTINRAGYVDTTTTTTNQTHVNMQHVTDTHTVDYQLQYYVFDNSPLILDLDKNGKVDTAMNRWMPHAPKFYVQYAKYFDITGDGVEDFTEWVAKNPSDGLLAVPDKNGKVRNALQLFGTAGGYIDGYEKLSLHFDLDGNGWVEGKELEGLKIWIDSNNDAVCQDSELRELREFDVKRICTRHKDYVSKYETKNGEIHTMWDWWPAAAETRKVKR